jgi:polysaccharide biosynthesis protein PslH
VTREIVAVLPAPPHPWAKNTAARYYAALLAGLANAGARVHALAVDDGSAPAAQEWMIRVPRATLECFEPPAPSSTPRARAHRLLSPMVDSAPPELGDRLSEVLSRGYDALHVEEEHLGRLAASAERSLLSVLHSERRDLEADLAAGSARRFLARRAEGHVFRAQRQIRAISHELAVDVRSYGVTAPIRVVPLCLDLDGYACTIDRPRTIGLIGSMFWPPTRAAALRLLSRIWPRVHALLPDAHLVVAGWRASSLAADVEIPPGVDIVSDLDRASAFFERIGILAFPLAAGSGMKIKVLESAAAGIAVVTTRAGLEGLELPDDPPFYIADTDDEFVDALVAAAGNDADRFARASAARQLLEKQISPDVVVESLLKIYHQL